MNFNDVMVLTRKVSSPTAFEDQECEAYFDLLMSLPTYALVVEVGLEFGRSSSIALQVVREHNLRYYGIEPHVEDKWLKMAHHIGAPFLLFRVCSNLVVFEEPIDLILIDGDHSYVTVTDDCNHFLPRVRKGGYALFHDFGESSLPDVYNAVRYYMDGNQHWIAKPVVGTLGIWRRA